MDRSHPNEILDVVDDENRVIDRAHRNVVHANNLPHRSVHLMIRDPGQRFLLQRRATSRPTFPNCWDSSVSGHIPAGMDYPEAVVKEAEEEIGFHYKSPIPVLLIEASPETGYEWTMLYAHQADEPLRLRPDPSEVQELRWWNEEEILHALVDQPDTFTSSFRVLFFLWREAKFVVPEPMNDSTYAIDWDDPDRLHVKRAMFESAGIPAKVSDDHASLVPGSRGGFFGRKDPSSSALCVPYNRLTEAIALLYLSRPAENE